MKHCSDKLDATRENDVPPGVDMRDVQRRNQCGSESTPTGE
jgi:hypothetical protein